MTYTLDDIRNKILDMYPEIREHGLSSEAVFDEGKNAYVLTFRRGAEALKTHIEKNDADECMNGVKCVYLGIQVAQFIKNFEEREVFGRKAA